MNSSIPKGSRRMLASSSPVGACSIAPRSAPFPTLVHAALGTVHRAFLSILTSAPDAHRSTSNAVGYGAVVYMCFVDVSFIVGSLLNSSELMRQVLQNGCARAEPQFWDGARFGI